MVRRKAAEKSAATRKIFRKDNKVMNINDFTINSLQDYEEYIAARWARYGTRDLHNGTYSVYMLIAKEDRTDPETGRQLKAGKSYVGYTSKENHNERWRNGLDYGDNEELQEDIKTFGFEAFHHVILWTGLSKEQAITLEIMETLRQHTMVPNGYNIRLGNTGQYAPFRGRCKPVFATHRETGETRLFQSLASFSRVTGVNKTSAGDAARGQQEYAGDYSLQYATPETIEEWKARQKQSQGQEPA